MARGGALVLPCRGAPRTDPRADRRRPRRRPAAAGPARLRGLVGTYPQRLDLRERLAELYRAEGDLAQAGRWTYLSEEPDADELRAAERAYPPLRLMQALAWPGGEEAAPSPAVRERLAAVRAQAEQSVGAPVSWADPRAPQPQVPGGDAVGGAILLTALGLMVIGAVWLLVQAWHAVASWIG
ncbi:MAG: DUF6584 family protein [Kineosporiaceae bacterium]